MALGKQMFSLGGTTMVKLKTGQLYDLMGKTDFSDDIEKMVKLRDNLEEMGIPMLYVYPHAYLYEDRHAARRRRRHQRGDGRRAGDGAGAGVHPGRRQREVYRDAGLTLDQAIYRTDQHCATPNIFATFRATAAKLSEMGFP
jgi:hypothetical protein